MDVPGDSGVWVTVINCHDVVNVDVLVRDLMTVVPSSSLSLILIRAPGESARTQMLPV